MNNLKDWNYCVSDDIFAPGRNGTAIPSSDALRSNLHHTEIDIVLDTPRHLFIGEAKDKSRLDAKSNYVLVHQLIREYVLAKMLLTILGLDRKIVQFVVGTNVANLKKNEQVLFAEGQGWLTENNMGIIYLRTQSQGIDSAAPGSQGLPYLHHVTSFPCLAR